ncbi:hypothetical protein KIN20_014056 [Parelaphostrongylus tenuis]|uniref:Uncharacterized protein n=1 Tax=Parelaphostrongylus tenuis TaxID=148309 RepID=A0AAD5MD20_PARTN|nr:hypothetical protein KIN20_014056 [Parelaphostrongylus tenuis]
MEKHLRGPDLWFDDGQPKLPARGHIEVILRGWNSAEDVIDVIVDCGERWGCVMLTAERAVVTLARLLFLSASHIFYADNTSTLHIVAPTCGVLVKSRQKFWLAIELLVPLILFVILALVRTRDFTDFRTQCHYDSKGFPSSGILPSLHSFLCSFSNTCHLSPTTGDETQFIHNSSAINESLLVDILYYSSLQLGRIGKNPTEFSQLLNIFTRLVKIFAAMNSTKSSYLPELQQFFEPSFNVTRTFEDLGLSQNAAEALTKSKLTPFFFIEAYSYGNELLSMSPMLLPLKAFESIPLLCNETIFNSSFMLPPNTTLTAEDRRSLQNLKILTRSDNSFEQSAEIANLLSTVISIVQLQPIYEGFRKWSHINFSSLSNITTSVFCGKNPFDISPEDLGPLSKGMKTAFDELKNKLISFIETVVPGKQQRGKQYCHGVRIHDDLNCSSLEVAVMQRLRLIDILNRPLRIVDFLRQKLFEYPESSGNLQNALYRSDLRAASLNILSLLRTPPDQPQPSWLKRMEFVLEHIFAPFSDPYSFGAITKNLTEAINKYTKCFLTDRFVTVANESILEETAMCLADYQQYFSGIVILNMTENATNFDPVTVYKIRHLPNFIDGTYYYEDSPRNFFDRNSPFIDLKYITYGFSFLQESIDRAIVTLRTHSNRTFGMYAQQEPFPCVSVDKFNVTVFFGLLMILSFIIPASLLVKNIVL